MTENTSRHVIVTPLTIMADISRAAVFCLLLSKLKSLRREPRKWRSLRMTTFTPTTPLGGKELAETPETDSCKWGGREEGQKKGTQLI